MTERSDDLDLHALAGELLDEAGTEHASPIPDRRHSLPADEDSVVLLSVAVAQRAPS